MKERQKTGDPPVTRERYIQLRNQICELLEPIAKEAKKKKQKKNMPKHDLTMRELLDTVGRYNDLTLVQMAYVMIWRMQDLGEHLHNEAMMTSPLGFIALWRNNLGNNTAMIHGQEKNSVRLVNVSEEKLECILTDYAFNHPDRYQHNFFTY